MQEVFALTLWQFLLGQSFPSLGILLLLAKANFWLRDPVQ